MSPTGCWFGVWWTGSSKVSRMKVKERQEQLAAQIVVLENLYYLAGRKREALLQEDMKTLILVNEEEEAELGRLKSLTPQEPDESGETTPELKELLLKRELLARRTRELNFFNREMIEDSLAYIRFSLQLFHGQTECSLYGTAGIKEATAVNSLIDMKG